MVLLTVSEEVLNRERNQEDPSEDSACDLADHSGYPSAPDGIPPQTSVSHGCSSWSLSPCEYGWNKVEVCLGVGVGTRGKAGWSCGLPEPG